MLTTGVQQLPFWNAVAIIAVIGACTFFTRILPFLLFAGKEKLPSIVVYLGKVLPGTVMAILVIYCLKDISFASVNGFAPQILACIIVALLHLWKHNNLLSIGGGTVIYMLLIQFVFV